MISRNFLVNQTSSYVFIVPYIKAENIDKKVKEKLRLLKVEPKMRGYLASDIEVLEFLSFLLT